MRVVVLRDPAAAQEATLRLGAELAAAGFAVVPVDQTVSGPPERALRKAAVEYEAFAAVAIHIGDSVGGAKIWASDRVTGRSVMRSIDVNDVPTDGLPKVLALRTVEVLRASLLEIRDPKRPLPPSSAPPATPAAPPPPLVPHSAPWLGMHFRLEGVAVTSFDELGPALGPRLGIGYGISPALAAQVSLWGPAFAPTLDGGLGKATIRQEAVMLGMALSLWKPPIVPFLILHGGAYHMFAEGELAPPFDGRSVDTWSAAAALGGGLNLRLDETWAVTTESTVLLLAPRPVVLMLGQPLGSAGRPSFVNSLGISARL